MEVLELKNTTIGRKKFMEWTQQQIGDKREKVSKFGERAIKHDLFKEEKIEKVKTSVTCQMMQKI